MQFMMQLAPITFPIAMLAGLGWCIGIALLEQPHGAGYALTRYCLMTFVVPAPWLTLKLTFYVIVGLGRKLGLIPPARPTHSLVMKNHAIGSEYWPSLMANAAVCPKSQSGETNKPPICSLTVGSWDNGAALDIASFRR